MNNNETNARQDLPVSEFKALTLERVKTLLESKPEGFRFPELAAIMGPLYQRGAPLARRLQTCLDGMCKGDVLKRSGGWYVTGSNLYLDGALGVRTGLVSELHRVFYKSGGIMRMSEILFELDREDDFEARLVRKVLVESPLYFTGLPFDGYRTVWLVVESERVKVPLPGRWLLLDLQMTVAQMETPRRSSSWGLEASLAAYKARISRCLRDTRELLSMSELEVVAGSGIGDALEWCLANANDTYMRTSPEQASEQVRVVDWWDSLLEAVGRPDALAYAWALIESDDSSAHNLLHALNVGFWETVGATTNVDAAWLSRGALRSDPRRYFNF